MLTYSEAQTMMRRAQNGRRKLGHNTYLHENSPGTYAVRYHYTDVVLIHADGTYTLQNGGWNTVTTNMRLNSYSPARIYSYHGQLCVWDLANDPKTPPKIQKCRVCKGTGITHTGPVYKHWNYDFSTNQSTKLDPPELVSPATDHNCYRCDGTGRYDYGSKSMPVVFFNGIKVDSDGRVINADGLERIHESAEVRNARIEADIKARQAAMRNEKRNWIKEHGLETRKGTVIMFKAVRDNLQSAHGARYDIGTTVTADDYRPTHNCGAGLHFSPTPAEALRYDGDATRFLACAVDRKTMILLDDKVKARSCHVLYEVPKPLTV